MVQTTYRTKIDSSLVRRREYNILHNDDENRRDTLVDTALHILAASIHFKSGEPTGHHDEFVSRRAEVSLPKASNRQGQANRPLLMVLTVAPIPYSNLAFLQRLVKAMATRIADASNTTLRVEKVVTLVH